MPPPSTVVPRDLVRRTLEPYVVLSAWKGWVAVATDMALYAVALAGVLFLPLPLKVACSLLAGVKIANLAALGHEAAHGTLVRSGRGNHVLAVACLLPGLFNYRLWIYDHHVHHAYTNGNHRDSWTPMSKAQFDALPAWRRALERLYRSPTGLGLAPYYIVERWLGVKLFPRAFLPARFRASAWRYFALVAAYWTVLMLVLATAPLYAPVGLVTALALGFALPFWVWMTMFSFTVYVQHTHPRIPWFEGPVDHQGAFPAETLSTHLIFPRWAGALTHNVYDHAAHHVTVRVPFYNLPEAQRALNALAGPTAVVDRFSLRWLARTMRACCLYDYARHRWLDFKGRPTSDGSVLDFVADADRLRRNHERGHAYVARA